MKRLFDIVSDARKGEYARRYLEEYHDRLSGNRIWTLRDKDLDVLVKEIMEMMKEKHELQQTNKSTID